MTWMVSANSKLSLMRNLMPREVESVRVVMDSLARATASSFVSWATPLVNAPGLLTRTTPDTPDTLLMSSASTL